MKGKCVCISCCSFSFTNTLSTSETLSSPCFFRDKIYIPTEGFFCIHFTFIRLLHEAVTLQSVFSHAHPSTKVMSDIILWNRYFSSFSCAFCYFFFFLCLLLRSSVTQVIRNTFRLLNLRLIPKEQQTRLS